MEVLIEFVDPATQRYDTVGDWAFTAKGDLHIRVSRMRDWRSEFLVALHEYTEAMLCKAAQITTADVDAWDITGGGKHLDEPGAHPECPYHKQHAAAEFIERAAAMLLNLDWHAHEQNLATAGT